MESVTLQTEAPALTPERIISTALGFWPAKTLLSAIELGLFTELAKGPLALEELRDRLGVHERSARDFFDALTALGMLQREGSVYSNTPETDLFLDRAKPSYAGGLLEMANARLYPFWGSLTEALRTGRPQSETKGGDPFIDLYADPARLRSVLVGHDRADRRQPPAFWRAGFLGANTRPSATSVRHRAPCRWELRSRIRTYRDTASICRW